MPITDCLQQKGVKQEHIDEIGSIVKSFTDKGLSERDAGIEAVKEFHKKISTDLNNLKKSIGVKTEKYIAPTKHEQTKAEFDKQIENISSPNKTEQNAIQEQSAGSVLQREQSQTGKTGGERTGMESGKQGNETTKQSETKQAANEEKVTKVGDPLRDFANKVRSGKISKLGGFKTSTGFDAVWDASLEVIAKSIEGGAAIADAIEAGLKHIRSTDWYKGLTDKKDFEDKYKEHINSEYEAKSEANVGVSHAALTDLAKRLGLDEPKRGEYIEPEDYADRGKRLLAGGADPNEVDNSHNTLDDRIAIGRAHLEDLTKIADAMAKKWGVDSDQFKKAQEDVDDYAKKVKELGTAAHRAMVSLQGERDLDKNDPFTSVKRSVQDLTGKQPSAEQEKKIQDLTESNQKLKDQADQAEAKLISETDKAFKQGVEEGKKLSKSDKAKTVANKLRENAKLHKPGTFSAATPASLVWDGAIEVVAKGIEAGGKIADVIEAGIKHIQESDWYKSLSDDKKQKAEKEFKQFNFDNASGNSLEDLQARFVDKKDNKFTTNEASAIWAYAKENYLDKGTSYRDMISQVSNDLGLTWRQVNEAISSPKTARISDEMWKKQAAYRRGQNVTKTWVEDQNKSGVGKLLRKVSGAFRASAVFGHGGIFVGTHAAPTLFQPTTWNKTIPAFFRGWSFAYGNEANYEKAMEELKNRPNYTTAQRAGLKNNPDRLNVEEYQNSQKFLPAKLAKAGEHGFNAIKVLRQDLFDYHFDKLSAADKQDPEVAKSIAMLVNNATGASNLDIPKAVNELTFAGGMEAARWGKLTTNPVKATATALKALYAPDKVSTGDKVFAKVWASRVGQQLATYTSLLAANYAIQKTLNPKNPTNLTNPNKSDFGKFKFGDVTVDPTSGMRGVASFIYGLGKIPFETAKQLHGDTPLQSAAKQTFGYGRGKLAPAYSTMVDLYTKSDYYGNPLPYNNEKVPAGKHKITWSEYAWQKAPLPLAEAAHNMYQSAIDNGANKMHLNDVLNGMASGAISGTTGFRVGEYNAETANHSPYTEEDYKRSAFKWVKNKGFDLPNVQLSSIPITDEDKGTKKMVSEYPQNIQDKFTAEHKNQLEDILSPLRTGEQNVYVKTYKDAKGQPTTEVTLDEPDNGNYKEVNANKLTKDQFTQLLSIAQKMATTNTKKEIFQ